LLLAGGLGVYFATSGDEPKPTPPPEVKSVERPTSLTNDTVQIPVDEEEDAGEAPPEEQPGTVKRPRPTGEVWSCDGDLDVAIISRVIAQAQSSVRACYERALRNDNQLQGQIKLEVRVTSEGKVSHTRIAGNSLRDPEVSKCVQGLAKQWSFPAVTKGSCAIFTAPFKLTPKN
jgi:outer membrane biosynthesis protein TonB